MYKRPQEVSTLAKNEGGGQLVKCQCGHDFNVPREVMEAVCPHCGEALNWALKK